MHDQRPALPDGPAPLPFIAADVGGTHARIGLLRATRSVDMPVEVLRVERYACAQWPSLGEILADFVARFGDGSAGGISHAVLACAGYVQDGAVINVNLPWPVSMDATRQRAGLQHVAFINDFEALAHAVAALDPAAMRAVVDPGHRGRLAGLAAGPIVVMGPGTGLGCAAVLPGTAADPQPRIVPSEASHTLLAPSTPRERAVVQVLAQRFGSVEVEHAISGPGLLNLYRAICQLEGSNATLTTPAEVTRAAVAGESATTNATATEALTMFCSLLGCFAANMAIAFRASGGVVLAGGILPQMEDFLLRSPFQQRFQRPGLMLPFLQQVPVHLVDHGELGIVGAGCWSLNATV